MKTFFVALFVVISAFGSAMRYHHRAAVDSVTGAWMSKENDVEIVLMFIDGYATISRYNSSSHEFMYTAGGPYWVKNDSLWLQFEFDTNNKDRVGSTSQYKISLANNVLSAEVDGKHTSWNRIDEGNENLAGLWKITARKQGDTLSLIHQTGTRKTIKILSGSRFQWAAIDPGAKTFMGTGGGSYTFKDGKYTEHIEFFSRDDSRVGQSLSFDGKLLDGKWHHSGLSSKGDPIYEVWSRTNKP